MIQVAKYIATGLEHPSPAEEFLGLPPILKNQAPPQNSDLLTWEDKIVLPRNHELVVGEFLEAGREYGVQEFADALADYLLKDAPQKENPTLWVIGGGSGSGKSRFGEGVKISTDIVKSFLPQYREGLHKKAAISVLSQQVASEIAVQIMNKALAKKRDIVYEAPLNDLKHPQEIVDGCPRFYHLKTTLITCDPVVAAQRVIERGRETGHYIKTDYLAEVHQTFNENLGKNVELFLKAGANVEVVENSKEKPDILNVQEIVDGKCKIVRERSEMKKEDLIFRFRNLEKELPSKTFHIYGASKPDVFKINPHQKRP